jgi:phosphatidylglycerophosphatase A
MTRDCRNKTTTSKQESKAFFFEKKKQKTFAFWVACGFGSGASPWAPGTAGSLVGLALGLLLLKISIPMLLLGTAIATVAGYAAIRATLSATEADADPGWIVIDEIAGQMLSLAPLHHITPLGILLAFALFRLFDITKAGPIGWADRQGGATGIMADDLIAGALAALTLLAIQVVHPPNLAHQKPLAHEVGVGGAKPRSGWEG